MSVEGSGQAVKYHGDIDATSNAFRPAHPLRLDFIGQARSAASHRRDLELQRGNVLLQPEDRSPSQSRHVSAVYSLLRWLGKWIPAWLARAKVLYVLQLPRERWSAATVTEGIRWATPEDTGAIDALAFRPPGAEARLARGGRAVVREIDGQLVGCLWFEPTAPPYENWLQLKLDETERWLSDSYVAPQYRGQGISGQLGTYGRSHLPADVTRVAAVATALNAPSLRSAEKAGYETAKIAYLRILGCAILMSPLGLRVGYWRFNRRLMIPLSSLRGR